MKYSIKGLLLSVFLMISFVGYAQDVDPTETEIKEAKKNIVDTVDGWKTNGMFSTNFTQTSFSNWASGGQNSVSVGLLFNYNALYRKKKAVWENHLDLAYGSLKQGGRKAWWKTDDNIDFVSKYGRKIKKSWYYGGLLNFKSQFADGYDYPNDSTKISSLFAPAYLLAAAGFDYNKSKNFSVFIAPFTARMIFVMDPLLANQGAFGVEPAVVDTAGNVITPGKTFRLESGGYIRVFHSVDVMENVTLQNKVWLFSNYLDHPENIDISWEMLLKMKVNKYITATLSTHLLYDDNIKVAVDDNKDGVIDAYGPRLQFKEVLGIGLSYSF